MLTLAVSDGAPFVHTDICCVYNMNLCQTIDIYYFLFTNFCEIVISAYSNSYIIVQTMLPKKNPVCGHI